MAAKSTKEQKTGFNLAELATSLQSELKLDAKAMNNGAESSTPKKGFLQTGIPGFDRLFRNGIPVGSNVLVSGSTGAGKTLFCLQMIMHHVNNNRNCLFISFEESEERLIKHMRGFGWDPESFIKQGRLKIKRYLTSDIYYKEDRESLGVQAMMAKNSDHLLLDLEPFVIGDEGFKPDITVIDSLSAVASTFEGREKSYRFYLERMFRFFENLGGTTFLVTEPNESPMGQYFSGTEEYLSDGIILFYNVRRRNVREQAVEVLKMRGEKHEKKIVALSISDTGMVVHPEQEVFTDIK